MNNKKQQKKTDWLLSVVFVGLITLPFFGSFFGWDFYPQQNENRKMASFPDIKNSALEELPDELTAYCDDHFGFRNTFIRRYQKIQKDVFNQGISKVLKGKTPGWFFYKKGEAVADFMGLRQLSDEDLETWKDALQARRDFLRSRNIPYVFYICPDKTVVYPENLPDSTLASRGPTRFEQLQAYMEANSDVEIIYPLPELQAAKDRQLLYFPGDTHWNSSGGYIGYRRMMQTLQRYFPSMKPIKSEDCTIVEKIGEADLATMYASKSVEMVMHKIQPPVEVKISQTVVSNYCNDAWAKKMVVPRPKLAINPNGEGTALVIHDSFAGHGFTALLPSHFNKTYFFFMYIETADLEQLVEDLNPDIVIEMRVERSLRQIPGQKQTRE